MAGHRQDVTELPGLEAPELGPTGRPASFFPEPAALKRHGPARIIAMCNQKGGVGKTTTTINLGATLAEYGRRVLAVDFDPQGALSAGLGVPTHDVPTIYDLLLGTNTAVVDTIVPTSTPGLDVIPANIDLSAAEVHLVNEVAREQILARVLRQVIEPVMDYIRDQFAKAGDSVPKIKPVQVDSWLREWSLGKMKPQHARIKLNGRIVDLQAIFFACIVNPDIGGCLAECVTEF